MRHNILAWLESTGPSADQVIVLTHNIDFLFLEAVLLPKLRAIGDPSLTIFADSASAAATFKTQAPLIWELGKRYRVIPVDLGPWRRFHPKAILVSSRDGAQLAIGSGNLTAGGWSGNFEAWATYSSDAEGLPVLASFADVLNGLPQLVAMPERTDASLTSVTSSSWFSGLPAPDGLLYSLRRPLLDQIAEVLPEPASEVWVISPYFDPTLTALREFADRVGAAIKVLAQPLRAGITSDMADSLPSTIRVVSATPRAEQDRTRFMHAKVYLIRTANHRVIFIGSANCSQAALTKGVTSANAELLAFKSISEKDWNDFIEELEILEEQPLLPEAVSIDDDPRDAPSLRINGARLEDGLLQITFSCSLPLADWRLSNGERPRNNPGSVIGDGSLSFAQTGEVRFVALIGSSADGYEVRSPEMWVDDEGLLSLPTPARRMQRKLRDAASKAVWSATEYSEIFEIFSDNLTDTTPYSGSSGREQTTDEQSTEYTLDDIFAEGFASSVSQSAANQQSGFGDDDFLKTLFSLFGWDIGSDGEDGSTSDVTDREEASDADLRDEELPTNPSPVLEQTTAKAMERHRKRLLKVVTSITSVLDDDGFIAQRPVKRLSCDIGALGLLLRKAHLDHALTDEDLANTTANIWRALFAGNGGADGSLLRYWSSLNGEQKERFQTDMQDPRLVAALTVWFYPDWTRGEERRWFNLSIALIAAKLPWLLRGMALADTVRELTRLSRRLLPTVKIEKPIDIWIQWLRDGAALMHIADLFKDVSQRELAQNRAGGRVSPGDLLWQGGLCVALNIAELQKGNYGRVRFLASGEEKTISGDYLYPVMDLLADENRALANQIKTLTSI
ncbi:phospholipase D-like domain-containing protein [Terriglobus sp. RCC_193]|uniref:phospholipase D-like domain-containing protein n=1 Tax=Terriglobus sp. RCC_193 TaxID=3239218 RepID=UPI00352314E0